jgi:hypothetical protein
MLTGPGGRYSRRAFFSACSVYLVVYVLIVVECLESDA